MLALSYRLPPSQLTIDVLTKNGRGLYKIANYAVSPEQIKQKVAERYRRYGDFPCLIRADWNTQHQHVRQVMAACLAGMVDGGKRDNPILSFVAINKAGKEEKFSLAGRWKEWQEKLKKK